MKKDKAKKTEAPEAETPAEGEDGAAPAEATGKKKPPLKMLIVAGAGALVVLGGGGLGASMLLGHHGAAHAKKKHVEAKKGGKDDKNSPVTEGPDGVLFYTMPDLVANIQTADGRPTFLKLKLAFEAPDRDTVDAIQPNAPRLNDMFTTFLRELRPEDLSGSQGTYQLRMELLRRVNLVIAPAKVNSVLIQEMLVQ